MSQDIRIVLVNTSHPGNIGAAARAMRVMDLTKMTLVQPKLFPCEKATARASGATQLLEQAQVVDSLDAALADCSLVFGASARSRFLPWPVLTAREAATKIARVAAAQTVAIVFGNERNGLSNEQLQKCHHHVVIPTSKQFQSLNLAAAVQIIAYEIHQATLSKDQDSGVADDAITQSALASGLELSGFFSHLEHTLTRVRFLNPKHPKLLMSRLRRLFMRAQPDSQEVNILRGMLTSIDRLQLKHKDEESQT